MKKVLTCLLILTTIAGCANEINNSKIKEKEEVKPINKPVVKSVPLTSKESLDFGEQFNNFNFHPTSFQVKVVGQQLVLDMDYRLSKKLVAFLSRGIDYSIGISFPDEIANITTLDQTEPIPGPKIQKGRAQLLKKHATFKVDLPNKLTANQIKDIEKDKKKYSLHIINKNMNTVYFLDDIQMRSKLDLKNVEVEDAGTVQIVE